MIFVRRNTFASVYRRPSGQIVHIPHGWTTRYDYTPEVIRELWSRFDSTDVEDFREHLRERLTEPERADDLAVCYRCDNPGDLDYFYELESGDAVCEDCRDHYSRCEDCELLYGWTTSTLHGTEVCASCRDNNWSYCDDCDGYYRDDDGCGTNHNNGCDCEAPAQEFVVRNDGQPALANDTRATITLPAGTISAEGLGTIANLLRRQGRNDARIEERRKWLHLSYNLESIGSLWQTKQGNFTKRLSRHAYKSQGLRIPADALSEIGNIGAAHSRSVDVEIEVTRDLNQSAEDFYHEDSCWWGSCSYSRCTLKSNGGFGLRSFDGYNVTGRAWVMPLKADDFGHLRPTHETQEPDAFVVFNGYGELSGYAPARIVAHMAGMTYRKIGFNVDPMYVNNEQGYLIAPEEIASKYDDGSLCFNLDKHATDRTLTNA